MYLFIHGYNKIGTSFITTASNLSDENKIRVAQYCKIYLYYLLIALLKNYK